MKLFYIKKLLYLNTENKNKCFFFFYKFFFFFIKKYIYQISNFSLLFFLSKFKYSYTTNNFFIYYFIIFFFENLFKYKLFLKIIFFNINLIFKNFVYNSKFFKIINKSNNFLKEINNELLQIFIFTFFFKNTIYFINWLKKKVKHFSLRFLSYFFICFNNLFKDFLLKLLQIFQCLGIFIIISGKFSIRNGLKKKKKIIIGNIKLSSKIFKLHYSLANIITINGIFSIRYFLSFI